MLAQANVTAIKLDCHVMSATSTSTADVSKVDSVVFSCEQNPVTATVFIDASYDGDIMVAVGNVECTAGREAKTTYNESLAGARTPGFDGVGGPRHVNALRDDGTIIKYVANLSELTPPGEADDALMVSVLFSPWELRRVCSASGNRRRSSTECAFRVMPIEFLGLNLMATIQTISF